MVEKKKVKKRSDRKYWIISIVLIAFVVFLLFLNQTPKDTSQVTSVVVTNTPKNVEPTTTNSDPSSNVSGLDDVVTDNLTSMMLTIIPIVMGAVILSQIILPLVRRPIF